MANKDFGRIPPPQKKVRVRLQDIGSGDTVLKTESLNVWDVSFDQVMSVVSAALQAAFGDWETTPPPQPIKAKVGKGKPR